MTITDFSKDNAEKNLRYPYLFFLLTWYIFFAFFFTECDRNHAKNVTGSWQLDSIYSFYNGFGYTNTDVKEEPLYHFQEDGRLRMTKNTEHRYFQFTVSNDTLHYQNSALRFSEKYFVVTTDDRQMVLRKEKGALFKGKNQERYEIKYFSRIQN